MISVLINRNKQLKSLIGSSRLTPRLKILAKLRHKVINLLRVGKSETVSANALGKRVVVESNLLKGG